MSARPDVNAIANETEALDPAQRLRLAVMFLEARKPDLALVLIRRVATELEIVLRLLPREDPTS